MEIEQQELNQFRSKTIEELADFFYNLFYIDVTMRRGGLLPIDPDESFVVAAYKNDSNAIIGALLLDIPAAASLAGTLSDVPPDIIENIIKNKTFTESLWDDLNEVLNITSQLFTGYDGQSVSLEEVYFYPLTLPDDAYSALREDYNPLTYQINIDGYGGGTIGVLDAENSAMFADISAPEMQESDFKDIDDFEDQLDFQTDFADLNDEEVLPEIPKALNIPQSVQRTNSNVPMVILGSVLGGIMGSMTTLYFVNSTDFKNKTAETVETIEEIIPYKSPTDIDQILIKSGQFEMGCTMEFQTECSSDELPSHSVILTHDFYMMKSEITQDLYTSLMHQNPSQYPECGTNCPVENISWITAAKFANRLSVHHNIEECYRIDKNQVFWDKGYDCLGYRLPTEAEWEYAARGQKGLSGGRWIKKTQVPEKRNNDDIWVFAGSNQISQVAWYGGFAELVKDELGREVGKGSSSTHQVCQKQPNDYGLCDMTGNVWEWIWDSYKSDSYQSARIQTDPIGPTVKNNTSKVLRGGSWISTPLESRTSYRLYANPNTIDSLVPHYGSFGMRFVRTVPSIKGK